MVTTAAGYSRSATSHVSWLRPMVVGTRQLLTVEGTWLPDAS
jgi:hypothetical protein